MAQWKQILVGVDGSQESLMALEWAGDEAVRHRSELVVLTAWQATLEGVMDLGRGRARHG